MNEANKEIKESDPEYLNCECIICGKRFHLKEYHKNKYKTHCCSDQCNKEKRRRDMSGANNHQYGLKGESNSSWKSNERISAYGYRLIRQLEHPFANSDGFVFEHRLVAEKYLLTNENSIVVNGKKYLHPDFAVHHKDENRLNNDVSNLEVMRKGKHVSLHNLQNPRSRDDLGRFI